MQAGTHVNGAGLEAGVARAVLSSGHRPVTVVAELQGAGWVRATDLGIPGPRGTGMGAARARLSFGTAVPDAEAVRTRRHTVEYGLIGYASTDRTSQWSGALGYTYAAGDRRYEVAVEDDFFALQFRDEYRTFAMRARVLRGSGAERRGAGAKLVFWTGTTTGLGFLGRDETYDLSRQHGGGFSHGILSADVYVGPVELSLGYDAEPIRATLQNGLHRLIDDGRIPALDRSPRVFVQLGWNGSITLY
ncbi:polymorphic toxin type 23 domain-containing protein [Longimicrobium sp.]|uniref:polymorphic toxin type 23 domain-containing protein n=1 Tax=Longimicrobium sp. TaxID=2029185 RepID=UPI002E335E3D|nr:polymorphic toxin type 23 domain-containing protein [Longimicrobium sp.]HEX6039852.1 polymorphic toxin type 23 domain-containing protein [Longimicrobium sp.]